MARIAIGLLVAGTVISVLVGWLAFVPPGPVETRALSRGENAAWLAHRWFGGKADPGDVTALATRMQDHGIRDLYFHVGPLDAQGNIPAWQNEIWRDRLAAIRRALPGMRAYAWLGGVTTDYYGKAPDTVDLERPEVRAAVTATAVRLVQTAGFDGIHYDLEIVLDGDSGMLDLMRETRQSLPESLLSAATPLIRPGLPGEYIPGSWSPQYYGRIARSCDQIAVMSYDTAMPTEPLYERLLSWQVAAFTRLLQDTSCRLVMGVPTYKEHTGAHNPSIEHAASALRGIARGLRQSYPALAFQGIGLYAEWTTEPRESDELSQLWTPLK